MYVLVRDQQTEETPLYSSVLRGVYIISERNVFYSHF